MHGFLLYRIRHKFIQVVAEGIGLDYACNVFVCEKIEHFADSRIGSSASLEDSKERWLGRERRAELQRSARRLQLIYLFIKVSPWQLYNVHDQQGVLKPKIVKDRLFCLQKSGC